MAELANRRLGYGKTMALLTSVIVGMSAMTTVAADGPTAITNIMKLIGLDKQSEDAAALRLAPPQKALPAPPAKPAAPERTPPVRKTPIATRGAPSWDAPPASDLDDEIPF